MHLELEVQQFRVKRDRGVDIADYVADLNGCHGRIPPRPIRLDIERMRFAEIRQRCEVGSVASILRSAWPRPRPSRLMVADDQPPKSPIRSCPASGRGRRLPPRSARWASKAARSSLPDGVATGRGV